MIPLMNEEKNRLSLAANNNFSQDNSHTSVGAMASHVGDTLTNLEVSPIQRNFE